MSAKNNRAQYLDALRGIAVISVFIFHIQTHKIFENHFQTPWNSFFLLGMFGVDLFYVLSGFFITKAILSPNAWSPEIYIKSRFLRIYPAYLFCLIIMMVVFYIKNHPPLGIFFTGAALHLVMLHNLFPSVPGLFNGVFWTLGVEFPYYFVMFAIAPLLRNKKHFFKVSFGMIGLAIIFRMGVYNFISNTDMNGLLRFFSSTQIIGTLDYFSIGGLAAFFNLKYINNQQANKYSKIYGLVGILINIACFYYVIKSIYGFWNDPFLVVFWRTCLSTSFGLIIFSLSFKKNSTLLKYTALPWIGKISFSFYLWHYPVINSLTYIQEKTSTNLKLAYVIALTLLISWLSWRFIEMRFHRPAIK